MLRQALSPDLIPIVAATFADRVDGEREARARFVRIAGELAALGADWRLIDQARRAVDDEHRHALDFAGWAAALGRATDPHATFCAPRVGPARLTRVQRNLLEMVSMCCLAETLASVVLGAALDVVSVPVVKDRLHEVLKDEVRHARLGWAALEAIQFPGRNAWLGEQLPTLLEAGVPAARLANNVWPVAPELGLLPKETLLPLFGDVLYEVVFPGFERSDIDTGAARTWAMKRGFAGSA